MVTVIGGNIRIIREMDMEHFSTLMEANTLGNSIRMTDKGTEFKGGQMEECIKENINRIKETVMAIRSLQLAMNITENTRITRGRDMES
jgi:hypothetical protein